MRVDRMAERADFNLIIEKVQGEGVAEVFAGAFGLDPAMTAAVLKSAPVIFATKLSRAEIRALTPRLTELSKQGFQFRITARDAKVPRVNWLVRPNFAVPANGSPGPFAFDFQNTAFICPNCQEAFAFTRLGKLTLSAAPADAESAPHARKSAPEPEAGSAPPLEELASGPLEIAESVSPTFSDTDLVEPLEIQPLEATPPAGPAPKSAKAKVAPPAPESEQELLPLDEPTADPGPTAAPTGEAYNVFVPEVKDKSRLEDVVKLLAEIRGVPEEEARKLTRRLMIPVAKGVSKEEAEKILMRFKKIKTTGRMTRATGGPSE